MEFLSFSQYNYYLIIVQPSCEVPALSDPITSNSMDLLGITETWLTTKETSLALAEMISPPPPVSPSSRNLEYRGEDGGSGLFISSAHELTTISLLTQTCLGVYLVNLNVVSLASVSSTFIVHLVPVLLSSMSYKIYCPAWPHSLMIWYWWGTSTFILIPCHRMLDVSLVLWSLSISINMWISLPTFAITLLILWLFQRVRCSLCINFWYNFWPLLLLMPWEFQQTIFILYHKPSWAGS